MTKRGWRLTPSRRCLFQRHKNDAHGFSDFNGLPGPGQLAGPGIDAEDHDAVGILVGRNQVLAGGINGETARDFAVGRLTFDEAEAAIARALLS